jgi:hypothetical protein
MKEGRILLTWKSTWLEIAENKFVMSMGAEWILEESLSFWSGSLELTDFWQRLLDEDLSETF